MRASGTAAGAGGTAACRTAVNAAVPRATDAIVRLILSVDYHLCSYSVGVTLAACFKLGSPVAVSFSVEIAGALQG